MGTRRIATSAFAGDGGSIVIGWLTRIVVVAAIVGVFGYDAVAIGEAKVHASDEADQIAQDAHDTWAATASVNAAYLTAKNEATTNGDSIVPGGFTIVPKTGLVTVTVRHTATTLLVKRFAFSRGWASMTGTGQAQDQS
jgi:nitroimidazol reductase NimA-like FMN-containing flavoprotein (pyridoxamine 5'-phosphate oxidase superfamily)